MEAIRIRGGHRFRIKHGPSAERDALPAPSTVGVSPRGLGDLKPKVVIKEGDAVSRGDVLFHDKRRTQVKFTAPAGGTVKEVRYGARRSLDAIIIEVSAADEPAKDFGATDRGKLAGLGTAAVVERLVASGLWTRMRSFPGWDIAPIPGEVFASSGREEHGEAKEPPSIRAIYVSALATEPHKPDPSLALEGHEDLFAAGLEVVKQIAKKTWLVTSHAKKLPSSAVSVTGIQHRVVEEKYPAENPGLQLYYTDRLGPNEVIAGLDVEDVIDIGHLFLRGTLRTERTYAVAGAGAAKKQHFLGRQGIRVGDLTGLDDDASGERRFVAGGLFSGTRVSPTDYLSPHERSVQVMAEDRVRTPFALLRPGFHHLTLFRAWGAGFSQGAEREASTSNNGEERACIQCGYCIDICPVQVMPNILFKLALEGDLEKMESSFIHDCVDCGLCSFICPSKIELAQHIEDGKSLIAKEG
jgi:Na+-transporting NADH:ubiquinone oxidoreductase subunit A